MTSRHGRHRSEQDLDYWQGHPQYELDRPLGRKV